jgi:hypothetical protein
VQARGDEGFFKIKRNLDTDGDSFGFTLSVAKLMTDRVGGYCQGSSSFC